MDTYGNDVRQLLGNAQSGQFNEALSDQIATYMTKSRYRNLRGEAANPNVLDEDGQMMSWAKYDALKARGIDPKSVANKRTFWGWDKASERAYQNAPEASRRYG